MARWSFLGAMAFGLSLSVVDVQASVPSLARAEQYVQNFQFAQAIPMLRQLLQHKLPKAKKSRVWLLWALCHYNQGRQNDAKKAYFQALSLYPYVRLPEDSSPAVLQFFQKVRLEWLQHRAQWKRNLPPETRRAKLSHRVLARKVPSHGEPQGKTVQPEAPSVWARHRGSFVLFGIGLAVLAGGIGTGLWYQSQSNQLSTLAQQRNPAASGEALQQAYQKAFVPGVTATALFGAAGALGVAGVIVLIVERLRPVPSVARPPDARNIR